MRIKKVYFGKKYYLLDNNGKKIAGPYEKICETKTIGVFEYVAMKKGYEEDKYLFLKDSPENIILKYNAKDALVLKYEEKYILRMKRKDERYYYYICDEYGKCLHEGITLKQYDSSAPKGNIAIEDKSQKYGVVDSKYNWIIKPEWDYIKEFGESGYEVWLDDKVGILNLEGDYILKLIHGNGIDCFGEDLFRVMENNNCYGIVDKNGKQIIPNFYSHIYLSKDKEYIELVLDTSKGQKYGVALKNGRVLIDCLYDEIIETHNKFFVVDNGKEYIKGAMNE